MAGTQVKLTSPPSSCVEDSKKHVMKIFKDLTKDCEDKELRRIFHSFGDYDTLNTRAMEMFSSITDYISLDEAKELFKPLPDQVTLPEVVVYTMVMQMYTAARKIMDAHKVYQRMIASCIAPATHTYTTIICAITKDFADPNLVVYAKKYFLEMLDRRMKPTYATYASIMDAISHREPREEDNKFLEQTIAKGFIPDYNDFRNKPTPLRIIFMCADLDHNNTLDRDVKKCVQKLHACPTKLTECARKMYYALIENGNLVESVEFGSEIKQNCTEPSVLYHTLVIEAYLQFGRRKGALKAYLAMLAAGVVPNSYTYTILIKGLAADPNFFGDAQKYLLEMMNKGKRPNAATYTAVIEGSARNEDKAVEGKGKEFVEVMIGKGFVPNAKAMREVSKGRPTPVIRRVLSIVVSKLKGSIFA